MFRFTSHSKWVQETTKMVCRSLEWRSENSTVCSGTDCSTPAGWRCQASTQPHARTGQRYRALPVFYQCTRRSNQALIDWSTPTRSFSQASTQQHARTGWSNQAFSVYATHKEGSNRASTQPHARTNHLNAVFTQSLTAVQGDAAQPPPTFSINQKRTTHPLSSSPHEKEPLSLLPTSTPQQSRTDQSKKPVPSFRTTIRSQWTFADLTPMKQSASNHWRGNLLLFPKLYLRSADCHTKWLPGNWQYKQKITSKKQGTLKRPVPTDGNAEVQHLKRSQMDKKPVLKMQNPKFKLYRWKRQRNP